MIQYKTVAHAKLNLTLDVVGRREDGYHDLKMVMQEISLGDELTLTLETGEPWRMVTDSGAIPCDDRNLCIKAAKLFFDAAGISSNGLTVELKKHTPVCAGMGGGSADGATVLRLLQQHYAAPLSQKKLFQIAEQVGSDVPFMLFGGTALAEGKGEILTRVSPMPQCHVLLCKPPFPISTPELFRGVDSVEIITRPDTDGMLVALTQGDISGVADKLYNVFEPVVAKAHPEISEIKTTMMEYGARNACMTGSGPTVFGIFTELAQAKACKKVLESQFPDTYLVHPV